MMDDTLPEILSGHHAPESREELHGALDLLLNAATRTGVVWTDPPSGPLWRPWRVGGALPKT